MTGTKAALTFPILSTYLYPLWMDLQFLLFLVAKRNSGLSFKKKNTIFKSCREAIQECSEGAQRGMSACPASAAQEAKNNHVTTLCHRITEATHRTADSPGHSDVYIKEKTNQAQPTALHTIIPAD